MICGIIVTHNPDIERLKKNIKHVLHQINKLIIVDNASKNQGEVSNCFEGNNIEYVLLTRNNGLAYALNIAFSRIDKFSFEWMITLDQDSVLPYNYIEKAKRYFDWHNVGIITCGYYEENLGEKVNPMASADKYLYVKRAITSAAIVRIDAYKKAGGYDNALFVDYVDFDFSIKIRKAGYKILYMNDVDFHHELGNSKKVRLLFWKIRYTSHSPERERLIARNITIFISRYKDECTIRDRLSLMKHFIFTILFDRDKRRKLKALKQGVQEGKAFVKRNA